jgi:hypothetical protein
MSRRPNDSPVAKAAWENNKKLGSGFIKVHASQAKVPHGRRKTARKKGLFSARVLRSLCGRALSLQKVKP